MSKNKNARKTTGKCMGLWSMVASKLGGGLAGFYASCKPTTTFFLSDAE
jgi:hypothetical protein